MTQSRPASRRRCATAGRPRGGCCGGKSGAICCQRGALSAAVPASTIGSGGAADPPRGCRAARRATGPSAGAGLVLPTPLDPVEPDTPPGLLRLVQEPEEAPHLGDGQRNAVAVAERSRSPPFPSCPARGPVRRPRRPSPGGPPPPL